MLLILFEILSIQQAQFLFSETPASSLPIRSVRCKKRAAAALEWIEQLVKYLGGRVGKLWPVFWMVLASQLSIAFRIFKRGKEESDYFKSWNWLVAKKKKERGNL